MTPATDPTDADDIGADDEHVREGTVRRANGEPEVAPDEPDGAAGPHRREGERLERHGRSSDDPHVPTEPAAPAPTARPEPPETG